MSEWFHAKVKFLRQMDNGIVKKITEQYLVDSMSFTECEARVIKEHGEGVREVVCQSIARSPIKEVVMYGDTDQFFKVKVQYSLMDEATEKEKKVTTYFLVNANDAKEAYERTEEHLKEMLVPFTIPKIEESPIIEVYQYEKQAPAGFVKVEKLPSANIKLTADLLQRREDVKRIFKDAYDEKVASWVPIIKLAMNRHNTDNPFNAVIEMAKEDHVDEITGSLMVATAVEMVEGNFEDEEDCAFEDDSVDVVVGSGAGLIASVQNDPIARLDADGATIEYTNPNVMYLTKSIDPTDGQSVAFVADPLRLLLESFGLTVSDDQLEEIEEMHEACGMVGFSEFMEIEHGLSLGDVVLVSNLLK